jgi:hypothetical protein
MTHPEAAFEVSLAHILTNALLVVTRSVPSVISLAAPTVADFLLALPTKA